MTGATSHRGPYGDDPGSCDAVVQRPTFSEKGGQQAGPKQDKDAQLQALGRARLRWKDNVLVCGYCFSPSCGTMWKK